MTGITTGRLRGESTMVTNRDVALRRSSFLQVIAMKSSRIALANILLAAAFLASCSGGENHNSVNGDGAISGPIPFQEVLLQGVDRYLGQFTPMSSVDQGAGVTRHLFATGNRPMCFTGNPFSMTTRSGRSDELLIFLQGGGICGPNGCAAVESPIPLFNIGLLNPNDSENPAADFDLGYVPYCDGSLFSGDAEVDSDGDGVNDRFFRGVQNLSAALDVIVGQYPSPSRILLAGNSAGGFGVHYALPLVRLLYPGVPIALINDSGVGILPPGSQAQLTEYWQSGAAFPASCPDCVGADGNLTEFHNYQLNEDPQLRIGFISSTQDEVATSAVPPDIFEAELLEAVSELEEHHPLRFRGLVPDSDEHTFILSQLDFPVGNTTVRLWITDMLYNGDQWVTVIGAED